MTLEYLISQYGYVALAIGTFLEGETILILAGFAAHMGHLKLPWVMAAAFLGTLAGDQFYFFLGREKGRAFLQRRPGWELKVERVRRLLNRYQTLLIIMFRFVYGIRVVTPFAIGLSGISIGRFFVLNTIGALVWSVAVALVGYLFGFAARVAIADVKRYEHWIFLGLLCAGALAWMAYYMYKWESDRKNHLN